MSTQRGLTLIELLIAVGILAVLALLATTLLNTSLESQGQLRRGSESLEQIGLSLTLLRRDMEQMRNRAGRDEYGTRQPAALLSFAEGDRYQLEFTRDGRRVLPGEQLASSLERIRYALEERQLVRYSAPVPDPAPNTRWRRQTMLDEVESMTIRFYSAGQWYEQWPKDSVAAADQSPELPQALALRFQTRRWGDVELIALVAGGAHASL